MPRRCAASRIKPAVRSENIPAPTLPSRNMGPEVEQTKLARVVSFSEMRPAFFMSSKQRLPTG